MISDVVLTTMEAYKRIVDVNILGVVRVTRQFLPMMKESKGRIVLMGSTAGKSMEN